MSDEMNDRDERGRFAPGNRLSPGRRPNETRFLKALNDSVSFADWRSICQRAVSDAKAGDWRARQWLSDYLVGRPSTILELSAADQQLLSTLIGLLGQRGIATGTLLESMILELDPAGLPVLLLDEPDSDDDDD